MASISELSNLALDYDCFPAFPAGLGYVAIIVLMLKNIVEVLT